jgi:paraquat-inducible protein B
MSDVEIVNKKPLLSSVWFVPLTAIAIGLWMVIQSALSEGPKIEITFSTAEGLKAGETRVKRLSVDLGVVEEVFLNDDFNDVTAIVRLDGETQELLREDTQFWVVRPRIGSSGISGLSTLLSGAYIELSPGTGATGRRKFSGLEDVPVTPQSTPGIHIDLKSERVGSISIGSPVLYNGYRVGKVEAKTLSAKDGQARYKIFVNAPYNDLITDSTRFWNASGISVDAGVDGLSVHTDSLETLLSGGISFGLPQGASPGAPVEDSREFQLYDKESDIYENPHTHGRNYLLLFDSSIRGLEVGAPVDYRGARFGTVVSVSMGLLEAGQGWTTDGHAQMPVLIRIEPGRLGNDSNRGVTENDQLLEVAVANGLRASLATGNIITGRLYVDLDYYEADPEVKIETLSDWQVFPTTTAGIAQIERQVGELLKKMESLPVEVAVTEATSALKNISKVMKSADTALADVNFILDDPATQALPQNVNATLIDLSKTLKGMDPESNLYKDLEATMIELRRMLRQTDILFKRLDAKPNSMVFSSDQDNDLTPMVKP